MILQHPTRIFWIYLTVLGLVSCALAWYTSATYGPGVGTDGAIQVSTADHLLSGQGYVDYTGDPFVRWPPLYPLTLAALSLVSGIGTFSIAWYLNIVLFGVIVWLGGALLYNCFPDHPLWAFTGSLVLASSESLLMLCATLGTDPLFTALCLAWVLVASRYIKTGSTWALLGMALLSCLGALQRLPGVVLIFGGAILILYVNRPRLAVGIKIALPFSILTLFPLTLWVLAHSYREANTLFGIPLFEATRPLLNFKDSLRKIGHWFLPYSTVEYIPPLILAGLPGLILLAISRQKDWRRLSRRLMQPAVFSSLVFVLLYYAFLILTINSFDTAYIFYDRYYIVMLAPVLVLLFAVLQDVLLARFERHAMLAGVLAGLLFAIWLVYPLHTLNKQIPRARLEGIPGYNRYNTRAMRQSEIVRVLKSVGSQEGVHVFSNYPGAVWFFLRREALASPRGAVIDELDVDGLLERYRGWPGAQPGYLIWFMPNDYDHVLDPTQLKKLAELELIYKGDDGQVYRVEARAK